MRKLVSALAVLGFSAAFASIASAGGACCKAKAEGASAAAAGGSCSAKPAAAMASGGSCSGTKAAGAAMASTGDKCCATKGAAAMAACCASDMPKMAYKVGDKTVNCPDEAAKLAGADGKMTFVVAGKDYTDKMAATKALGGELNNYYTNMLTVKETAACAAKTCPVTGKEMAAAKPAMFAVASYEFANKSAAEKAAAAARAEAEKIQMKMVVDGKEYTCSESAKAACTSGKKMEYVVGDTKSCCDVMAGVELTKARIMAAQNVLATASKSPATASRG